MTEAVAAPGLLTVTPGGHDVSVWAAVIADAPRLDLAALCARAGIHPPAALVMLAAHPDDETIGAGRLASMWARLVGPVIGVVATAGEACVDHVTTRPAEIAAIRMAEWQAATAILGLREGHALGLPDGGLERSHRALMEALHPVVTQVAREGQPVVLAAPWRHDPHPDHRAVGRAAAVVSRLLGVPLMEFGVWMSFWSEPSSVAAAGQHLVVLDHDDRADRDHRAACACFVSQLTPLAPELTAVVPPDMLAHQQRQLLMITPQNRTHP